MRYCTLTSTNMFFASGLGVPVNDASLCSGVGYDDEVSPADHAGILLDDGGPAPVCRGPNSLVGSERRLQSVVAGCVCGTALRACGVMRFVPLLL